MQPKARLRGTKQAKQKPKQMDKGLVYQTHQPGDRNSSPKGNLYQRNLNKLSRDYDLSMK